MNRLLLPLLTLLCLTSFGQSLDKYLLSQGRFFYPAPKQTGRANRPAVDGNVQTFYTSWANLATRSRESNTPIWLTLPLDSVSRQSDWASLRAVRSVKQVTIQPSSPLTQDVADSLLASLANWPELTHIMLVLYYPRAANGTQKEPMLTGRGSLLLKSVRELTITGAVTLDNPLRLFGQCPALTRLTINKYDRPATYSLPVAIGQMTHLRELHLTGSPTVGSLDSTVQALPNLTALSLTVPLTGAQLTQTLSHLPNLRKLSLRFDGPLPDPNKLTLRRQTQLDTLIWWCKEKTVIQADSVLAGLRSLKMVDMGRLQLTSMNWLAANAELRVLHFWYCQLPPLSTSLSRLTKLETIEITNPDSLRQFPESFTTLPALQRLAIRGGNLPALPPSIGNLTSLTALELSGHKLQTLPVEMGHLKRLRKLQLVGSQLTEFPAALGNLGELTELRLSSNELTSLPPGFFANMPRLRTLSLDRNKLTALPDALSRCRLLTNLLLTDNQLTALPDAIGVIDSLRTLDVSRNRLRSLPASIGKLQRLERLSLSGSRMTALPESLGNCRALISLTISDSTLTALPNVMALANLKWLELTLPQLQVLPAGIASLTALTSLQLIAPQLLILPDELGQLTKLNRLTVSSSRLMGLPNSLGRLRELTDLSVNGLADLIKGKPLGSMTQLPDSISRCTQLTTIRIANQQAFDGSDALQKTTSMPWLLALSMDNCGIDRLTDINWRAVPLQQLSLMRNSLRDVPEAILDAPKLQSLELFGNYPLPNALKQSFYGKEMLKTAFIEVRLSTSAPQTDKPDALIMRAYINSAMRLVQQRNWGEAFAEFDKALLTSPDTLKALTLSQRAELRMFRREYALAITDYEQAIGLAPKLPANLRSSMGSATPGNNGMVAQWWGRLGTARSALGQYDKALADLGKAIALLPENPVMPVKANFYTEQAKANANLNRIDQARTSLMRANETYAAMPYRGPGERLTEVELAVLTNQPAKAKEALAAYDKQFRSSLAMGSRGGYQALYTYLQACVAVLSGDQTPEQAQTTLTTYLQATPQKIDNWSFDLFEAMLPRLGLSADKVTALTALTNLTKQQAVKRE